MKIVQRICKDELLDCDYIVYRIDDYDISKYDGVYALVRDTPHNKYILNIDKDLFLNYLIISPSQGIFDSMDDVLNFIKHLRIKNIQIGEEISNNIKEILKYGTISCGI